MKRINALLLLNLSLPSLSIAQSYDDINFNEYLNRSGYKYFSKFYSKKIKDDVKDPIYQEYFDSIYILNSIQLDNEQEFLRIEQLIQKSRIKNNHLLLEIAQKYEEKENFNKALELYNQLSSSDDEINLKRVYLNILQENFDAASNILKKISDKFEKEKAYYEGILLFYQKEYDKSLEAFDFIKTDPKFQTKIPCYVIQCYFEKKKYNDVIDYVKKIEKDNIDFENKINVYRIAGDAALLKKNFDEAITFYDKALKCNNDTNEIKQTIEIEQISLAEPPARQSLNVINLDDLDEISDIENANSDDDYILDLNDLNESENQKKEETTEKTVIEENKKEVVKKNNKRTVDDIKEEEIKEEIVEEKQKIEVIFNIYDEIKVREAYAFFKEKKYEDAKNLWQQVSEDDPYLFQLANYYTGITTLKENKIEEALQYFDKARTIVNDSNIQAETILCCTELNYNLKNFDIAKELIKDFKVTFQNHKLSEKIDEVWFKIAVAEKNYDDLIEYFENIEEKSDSQKTVLQKTLLFKGNDLFYNKNYNAAVKMYEKSLDEGINFQYNNQAYYGLGECYFYLKNFDQALKEYLNVDESSSKYPFALLGMAYIQFNSQKYDLAQKNFQRILNLYRNKFDKNTIGEIKNRLGDCAFTKKQYQTALNLYKTNTSDHSAFYQGIIYDIRNDNASALNCFRKISSSSTYYEKALIEIGTIQLSCNQLSKAIETFSSFLVKYPESESYGSILLKRATAYANLKNFSKAQEDYEKYLDTFPADSNSSKVLTNLLDVTKNEKTRQNYIDKYKNKIKNVSTISFNEGKKYFYEQDYSKAVEIFEKFIKENKKDKNYNEACYLLAESYRLTKDFDKSISLYNSLANQEGSPFAIKSLIKLGLIYKGRGDHANAIKYFEKLKLKSKTNRDKYVALNGLMHENYLTQNFEQAINYANGCLELNLENPNIFIDSKMMLLRCNFELNRFDQVLKMSQGYLKDNRFASSFDEILFLKAESLYSTKKFGDSLNTLFDLTKKYQNSRWFDDCYILMAKNYIAQNRITQANKTLDSIIKNSNDEKLKDRAKTLQNTLRTKKQNKK